MRKFDNKWHVTLSEVEGRSYWNVGFDFAQPDKIKQKIERLDNYKRLVNAANPTGFKNLSGLSFKS